LKPQILSLVYGSEHRDKVTPFVRDFVLAIQPDMMPQLIDEGIRRMKSNERKDNVELAASNLGAFGKSARLAVPRLLELLHDPDVQVRARAAVCLGFLEEPAKVVPGLTAALDDPRIVVRARAAESLKRLGKDAQSSVESLKQRTRDESEWVRTVAAEALQVIQ
jgi:HEAT repeat protein